MSDSENHPRSVLADARAEVVGLIGEVRGLAGSEIAYYKARFDFTRRHVQRTLIFAGAALALLFCLVVALFLGLLLILAATLGPVWATLIVCGVLLLFIVIAALLARREIKTLSFKDERPSHD